LHIHEDQVKSTIFKRRQRFPAVCGNDHAMSSLLE
jgi:hypothetical protein